MKVFAFGNERRTVIMKFSLIKNDKSTYWDEVVLALIILAFVGSGIALIVVQPAFWFIDGNDTILFGVLLILIGAMFFPGLIYRLFHNDN